MSPAPPRARRPNYNPFAFDRVEVSPFIMKLHALVSDPRSDDVVRWTPDGRSFVVRDAAAFERRLVGVLPAFPSRANMSAFAREVKNYGFVLAAPAADGGETGDASELRRTSTAVEGFDGVAFAADGFRKDEPERLAEVRPKENFGRFRRDAKSDAP